MEEQQEEELRREWNAVQDRIAAAVRIPNVSFDNDVVPDQPRFERLCKCVMCREASSLLPRFERHVVDENRQVLEACVKAIPGLRYVAGVDISETVCVMVVLDLHNLEQVCCVETWASEEDLQVPYVPGYLAFREYPMVARCVAKLQMLRPELMNEMMLMIDGNGLWHPKGAGLACHVGVQCDLPTVGVAKNLYEIKGITKAALQEARAAPHADTPAHVVLHAVANDGQRLGAAIYPVGPAKNPVFASAGHRVSLDVAILVTVWCMKYRVPEPTRLADQIGRALVRARQADLATTPLV
ncbi:Endonuclease V [Porphyridium purpureum]|uniref:Endonuclease V n=1 Tax=Porphyridium purpureum TaxID=35688 RepID=A0A5J4YLI8_PORPP|nr:Endonuclease V [Porphyridium purpureum]|eukprot:POR9665..scf244_11